VTGARILTSEEYAQLSLNAKEKKRRRRKARKVARELSKKKKKQPGKISRIS